MTLSQDLWMATCVLSHTGACLWQQALPDDSLEGGVSPLAIAASRPGADSIEFLSPEASPLTSGGRGGREGIRGMGVGWLAPEALVVGPGTTAAVEALLALGASSIST